MPSRVAIVVDWLTDSGGAETVFSEAFKVFPDATLHALVDTMGDAEHRRLGIPRAHTSWLQGVGGTYRKWLPLMPAAMRSLKLGDVDVVLAISHAVALRAPVREGQKLLCLSLSPMRYAWDLREQYLAEAGLDSGLKGMAAGMVLDAMRDGDVEASKRVDAFAVISRHIAERVKRCYGRESEVIHPPVDTEFFTPADPRPDGDYYVTASRFVPYKRVDLIAAAFAESGRRLVVVGDGPDNEKVRAAAEGAANVSFVGHADRETLRAHLRGARAFVFAAEEDFGIAPVEAQACGIPVIAYGKGGILDTVVPVGEPNPTGVFFGEQSVSALNAAVTDFEATPAAITGDACREQAARFGAERFRRHLADWVGRHGAA